MSTITQFPSGNTQYRIEFDYLARTFVVVTLVNSSNPTLNRVLEVGRDYRFLNPTMIEMLVDQSGFDIVRIHRQTGTDLVVDFRNGSVLTASDLTNAELQAIHIAEEGRDQTVDLAKEYADAAGSSAGNAKDSEDEARRIAASIKAAGLFGYITRRSFEKGFNITTWNEVLLWEEDGDYYRWDGTLPKNVPAGSTPDSSAWVSVGDASLRSNLASANKELGDSLITVKQPFEGSILRTQHDKNSDYVNVKDFGAIGDGITDDTAAIKSAIAYAGTIKGVVYFPDGIYKISSTLALPSNVSIVGRSRESVFITKTTSDTVTVLVTSSALSGGYNGVLPTDMNAVICLGDSNSSRWSGVITGVTLYGNKTTAENHGVEFGIVNTGVVSDAKIEDVYVYDCKHGLVLPVIFASQVGNNRFTACLGGMFINNGTSCVISTNYSNSCRDYGHWYRDLKYSVIEANACDYTNRNDYYPDRTRVCYGYVFQNLLGVTVTGNGQEGTLGINWRLDNFDHSSFTTNTSIRLGSDYTGPSNISWLELNGVARNSIIENNVSYEYNSNGMLFGGAVAGQHHNIYISDITYFNAIFRNNIVRSTRNGVPVEAGWLNNVTRTVANSSAKIRPDRTFANGDAGSPTLSVQSGTNAVISYGEYTVHNINYVGDFAHIFGVFDVTITWDSGTSQLVSVTGFPTARDYAYISVTGVNNGDVGFTSGNIPASFRMNIGSTGGAFFTEGEKGLRIDAVVSGKRMYISYDGWYRVSP